MAGHPRLRAANVRSRAIFSCESVLAPASAAQQDSAFCYNRTTCLKTLAFGHNEPYMKRYLIKSIITDTMTVLRPSVARAIRQLGSDINRARRVRRMPTADFASRMGVGRSTLARLERGDPGVSIGSVAAALAALGELQRLSGLIDPSRDNAALLLSGRDLPERIRTPVKGASTTDRRPVEGSDADSGSVAF